MSKRSEESLSIAVDSSAPNIIEQAVDKEDTEIAAKVGHISLEGKSKINHNNHTPSVSTTVCNNDSSKDGILEGEEGELDYEEDEGEILEVPDNKPEPPKQTTSKEKESDGEDGELEDGEVNSDGEEGEIFSDQDDKDDYKKMGNKEEGEINEDDLEEGEVRDGDPYSSNQGSRVPRKLCRYFVSGSCTWGVSCRFLHPGVNDKGAYHMLPHPGQYPVPYVRPPPPPLPIISDAAPASVLQVPTTDLHPEDEDDLLGQPETTSDVKAAIPEKETAWERGIRLAKENKKAALRRKEEDTDFEQKRMLLSISVDAEDEEGNKENQAKRQDVRERIKKEDNDRGPRSSRWRDSTESSSRYYNKDRDKKKRRSRRSPSSSPERSKYDRRRDEKESSKTSDREQDVDRWRDKGRSRNPKPDEQKKDKKEKEPSPRADRRSKEPSVSSTKDVEPSPKAKPKKRASKDSDKESSQEEEGGEADKSKGKSYFSISNNRLANDDWHDPWQRTTSPKRRSPRRRSTTSTYSSRSRTRSSSSSSASSRSSRSRSRTPSSTGSESRSSSRSVSRSPSRSPSQTPSGTSSRSLSRSETQSGSDRSSTSSRASSRKDRHASKASSNKASSSRNQTMSPSGSESESHSDSESDSDHRRSHSSSPHRPSPPPPPPPPPPRSPPTRAPRGSTGAQNDRSDSRYRKDRYEMEHKYRQTNMVGWDRRNRDSWHDPYGRGSGGDRGCQRRDRDRRRRSRTPPARRDADQRRAMEEASTQSHNVDNTSSSRPVSSRDHYRRGTHSDNRTSSDGSSGNAQAKSSSRSSSLPSNESWSAERRKQSQSVWMASGSVRYTGHKDIKLTLNKSAGKAPSSTQSPSSRQPQHSPPRQAEASSSSSSTSKDPEKKRWPREPESSQRHSSPRDDVTSSQVASKPIKRAADSVLTPRHVETQSNKRNIEESTSKRSADDKRPLKRSADSAAANTKKTLPETLPNKQSRESLETSDSKSSHASNTARREELLRELKAVEDAIARKRARIE